MNRSQNDHHRVVRDRAVAPHRVPLVGDPERFALILKARRHELGLSQSAVHAHGGPSDLTMRRLERAATDRPDFDTLASLDGPMQWKPGSAARAFQGGDPAPVSSTVPDAVSDTARPAKPMTGFRYGVIVRTDALADITRRSKSLDALEDLPAEVNEQVTQLRFALDRMTRAWIIHQAELARRDDTLADLVIVLDDHLRTAPTLGTEDDIDDLHYLRWVAGYTLDIPADTEVRYQQRYADAIGEPYRRVAE